MRNKLNNFFVMSLLAVERKEKREKKECNSCHFINPLEVEFSQFIVDSQHLLRFMLLFSLWHFISFYRHMVECEFTIWECIRHFWDFHMLHKMCNFAAQNKSRVQIDMKWWMKERNVRKSQAFSLEKLSLLSFFCLCDKLNCFIDNL